VLGGIDGGPKKRVAISLRRASGPGHDLHKPCECYLGVKKIPVKQCSCPLPEKVKGLSRNRLRDQRLSTFGFGNNLVATGPARGVRLRA
jgi:hypothetical protein